MRRSELQQPKCLAQPYMTNTACILFQSSASSLINVNVKLRVECSSNMKVQHRRVHLVTLRVFALVQLWAAACMELHKPEVQRSCPQCQLSDCQSCCLHYCLWSFPCTYSSLQHSLCSHLVLRCWQKPLCKMYQYGSFWRGFKILEATRAEDKHV